MNYENIPFEIGGEVEFSLGPDKTRTTGKVLNQSSERILLAYATATQPEVRIAIPLNLMLTSPNAATAE